MTKVIIAGSRNFNDYEFLKKTCDELLKLYKDIEIVSGTASGADKLGEKYAQAMGYNIKRYPADWNKYGKRAGYIRNSEMAKYGNILIAFWDGISKGTNHMINLANENNLIVHVIKF